MHFADAHRPEGIRLRQARVGTNRALAWAPASKTGQCLFQYPSVANSASDTMFWSLRQVAFRQHQGKAEQHFHRSASLRWQVTSAVWDTLEPLKDRPAGATSDAPVP